MMTPAYAMVLSSCKLQRPVHAMCQALKPEAPQALLTSQPVQRPSSVTGGQPTVVSFAES